MSFYRDLVARAFLAQMTMEAEQATQVGPPNKYQFYYQDLHHYHCQVLDLLAWLESEESNEDKRQGRQG